MKLFNMTKPDRISYVRRLLQIAPDDASHDAMIERLLDGAENTANDWLKHAAQRMVSR